jgi:tetratricopeptide (TPR) repeat protein
MLECASVVGEKFGSEVVGLSLGLNRISTLKTLSSIEKEHRLIHSLGAKYCFDHSKIREVMYSGINAELRAEYHRIVAQSYEQLFLGKEAEIVEELAHHYLQAGDTIAAKYLKMAGDRATGRYANEEAIKFYSLAMDLTDDPGQRAYMLEKLGDLFTIVGQCDKAIATYSSAIEIAKEPVRKADLHRKMTLTFERHSEYERGIAAAQTGLDILGGGDDPVRCGLFNAMSLNYIRMGSYDKALEILYLAMTDATRLSEKKEIANTHRLMGITWWFRGDYDKALEHYQSALVIQREIGDDSGKESTLNNIGVVYMETGHLDEALDYFMEGLEYGEMVGDKSGMASTLDNLGGLYHAKGEAEKALGYQLRGLELYKMAGDKNGIAWSLSSLGYAYPDLGDVRRGIESHLESIELCKEIGDQHILIYDYYGVADSYSKIGEFEQALRYVDMALTKAMELGARREEGASLYVLGAIQCKMKEYDKSRISLQNAREILTGVGETSMLDMIDYDYGILLKSEGNIEEAASVLRKAHESFKQKGMGIWLRKTEEALAKLEVAKP